MTASSATTGNERGISIGRKFGPAPRLRANPPALRHYHLLPSVRGDLLFKLNRLAEARAGFGRAAALTRNAREQILLLARAAAC